MSRHTPTSSLLALALGLASLCSVGCYTGPVDLPDGEPWDQADDEGSEGPGSDASGGQAEGSGAGEGDGSTGGGGDAGDAGDAADAGDAGDAGDSGDAGESGDAGGSGDAGESGDAGDSGEPPTVDVPDNAYCEPVAAWDPTWVQLELDILELVNQRRAAGANCGSEGSFGATGPLTMQPALRCAARKHSKDMHDRSFFDHTNPSGESPWDRMAQAGYTYSAAGENIAGGSPDAAGTMNQWMNSDGHCANIMNPTFEEIGVGYYPGGQWGTLWTQAFGAQ